MSSSVSLGSHLQMCIQGMLQFLSWILSKCTHVQMSFELSAILEQESTGLLQPVGLGVRKPLKNRIYNACHDSMIAPDLELASFVPPDRDELSCWFADRLYDLEEQSICSAS